MIDKNKTYRTRDGRDVRIYATDGGGEYPVHGATLNGNKWVVTAWRHNGSWRSHPDENYDLIEVKPRIKRTVWMNVYRDIESVYHSKEGADCYAEPERLACIPIEIDVEDKS